MASDKQAQNEKPKKRSRVKETFAELKKVTWPTFGKTMKQTGAVFVVTIFFLVILLAMDQLLGLAHRQLISGLGGTEEAFVHAVSGGLQRMATSAKAFFASTPFII